MGARGFGEKVCEFYVIVYTSVDFLFSEAVQKGVCTESEGENTTIPFRFGRGSITIHLTSVFLSAFLLHAMRWEDLFYESFWYMVIFSDEIEHTARTCLPFVCLFWVHTPSPVQQTSFKYRP